VKYLMPILAEKAHQVNGLTLFAHPQFWLKPWAQRGERFLRTPSPAFGGIPHPSPSPPGNPSQKKLGVGKPYPPVDKHLYLFLASHAINIGFFSKLAGHFLMKACQGPGRKGRLRRKHRRDIAFHNPIAGFPQSVAGA
jgi:hypothetical protein